MPRKKKETSDKQPSKSLFDHINHIYQNQSNNYWETLTDADKKTYSNYMVNRFLSMNVHQLPLVNEIQKYTQLSPKDHYRFYISVIPRGKQFNKYVKGKTEDKYEPWLVELISSHYGVSKTEGKLYLDILYGRDTNELKELCRMYAVDPKLIKKAKL